MAKTINNKKKKDEVKQDNINLLEFYKLINDNMLHVETLLFTSRMLNTQNFSFIDKIKVYLQKYNSTLCVSCNNDVYTVVSLLNNMANNVVNQSLKVPFIQYKSAFLIKSSDSHSRLPIHELRKLLEGVLYNEKSKEEVTSPDCFDIRNDYNDLLAYFKNRLNYFQFLTDKLNSFTIDTDKDKEVYDEIKGFISKFR